MITQHKPLGYYNPATQQQDPGIVGVDLIYSLLFQFMTELKPTRERRRHMSLSLEICCFFFLAVCLTLEVVAG